VSAAQQMQMQMMHRLTAIIAGVDDDSVSTVQLVTAGDLCRGRHQMAYQCGVLGKRLGLRGDMLFGNDQDVGRCLRIDVRKPDGQFILINATCWYRAMDDLAEQAVRRRRHRSRKVRLVFHLYRSKYLGC